MAAQVAATGVVLVGRFGAEVGAHIDRAFSVSAAAILSTLQARDS